MKSICEVIKGIDIFTKDLEASLGSERLNSLKITYKPEVFLQKAYDLVEINVEYFDPKTSEETKKVFKYLRSRKDSKWYKWEENKEDKTILKRLEI